MNVFLKFSKSADFKIYLVIIFASVTVLFMGVNLYQATKDQMISLSDKNKIATTQNIVKSFDTWLHERIQALSTISLIMQNLELADDNERLSNILNSFYKNSNNFDAVQFLKDNGDIFVNGKKYTGDDAEFKQRTSLVWFVETKQTNSPTINFIANHTVLNTEVLNICVPSHKNGEFVGVLCGVVKISNIFKNIRNLKLSPNFYYFIVTHSGEVLTQMSDINLKEQIQSRFKEMFLAGEDLSDININSNFISLAEIPSLNWFVGAGAYDERQVSELLLIFQNSAALFFISFLVLILLANLLHSLI
ncbi:cache domain-containing protein [Campylobacter californiensis]|uniref:cache domain-containing protein n=1 Tax=Campylobacter californiensis TaxID=1032243 RepID=UPI001D15B563|nr:cache domain-containing protein [Campylobacter sp. RM13119]